MKKNANPLKKHRALTCTVTQSVYRSVCRNTFLPNFPNSTKGRYVHMYQAAYVELVNWPVLHEALQIAL